MSTHDLTHPQMSVSPETPPPARLNIFALPSRTSLLFALIVLVILLPVLAMLVEDTPLWEPLVLFCMVVLPIRAFLRHPQVNRWRWQMTTLPTRFGILTQAIHQLAAEVGVPPPQALLSQDKDELRVMGTWRQRYLVIPKQEAERFLAVLASNDPARQAGLHTALLHELSHFKNRDIVPTFLSRSLLLITLGFMSLSLGVSLMQPWLYPTLIRLFDFAATLPPELLQWMRDVDPETTRLLVDPPPISASAWLRYLLFILAAHWPLIVSALFLLVFFWRALLRTRELYADARMVEWGGDLKTFQRDLRQRTIRSRLQAESWRTRLMSWLQTMTPALPWPKARQALAGLLAYHHSTRVRLACLEQPHQVYGNETSIALTAGVAVVLLNLALDSLFLSRYLRSPNAPVPFVLGFTVLALSFLPALCACAGSPAEWRRRMVKAVLIFTGVKLIPQLIGAAIVVFTVFVTPYVIDLAAYTLVGGSGEMPPLGVSTDFVLDVFVWRPLVLFVFVMPVTLGLWLGLDTWLKRQVLTWYSAPQLQKHPVAVFYGLTGWLALVLWFVVLPIYNVLTVPSAHELVEPFILGRLVATLLVSLGLGIVLITWHRRYAHRCPDPICGRRIKGPFYLGKRCGCGGLLHPWLVARAISLPRKLSQHQDNTVGDEDRQP